MVIPSGVFSTVHSFIASSLSFQFLSFPYTLFSSSFFQFSPSFVSPSLLFFPSLFHSSSSLVALDRYDKLTQDEILHFRKPIFRYGVWMKPKLSARTFKMAKTRAVADGRWVERDYGLPPSRWWFQKESGGHGKRYRTIKKKKKLIAQNMEAMPKMIEEWKKQKQKKREKAKVRTGLDLFFPEKFRKPKGFSLS